MKPSWEEDEQRLRAWQQQQDDKDRADLLKKNRQAAGERTHEPKSLTECHEEDEAQRRQLPEFKEKNQESLADRHRASDAQSRHFPGPKR